MPEAWPEAGAAEFGNVIGQDPGLRDPASGDFHADLAPGYGCRVFPDDGLVGARPVVARIAASSRTGATANPLAQPPVPVCPRPSRGGRQSGRIEVGGVIDTDTVWDAAEVRVIADIEVEAGATLTVAAGARVVFSGFYRLTVRDGSLQACGLPTAPIIWTSERSDIWQPDAWPDGAWNGLAFVNVPAARDSSRLRWCVLEYSKALPDRGRPLKSEPVVGGELAAGLGGAVRVAGASPLVITHCVFRCNLAERGGAIGVHYNASPLLVNNLFHDNHALLRGAGLYASHSYPVLVHNTFTANWTAAPSPFVRTGCIDHAHAKPLHLGGILWGNPTSHYDPIQIREAKAFYTRYCNVEGWLGGEGCQTDDPLLDSASEPPYRPALGSPAIDAGDVAAVGLWLPALDLAGNARISGPAPDLGAYEAPAATAVEPELPAAGFAAALGAAPNPFNPQTMLSWRQPQAGRVRLAIYDPRGRRVRNLIDGEVAAGWVSSVWDGCDQEGRRQPAGVYLARLETSGGGVGRKLVLVP